MGKVLLFNVNVMKDAAIRSLCSRLSHMPVSVTKEQYQNTIGALAGLSPLQNTGATPQKELADEMMVLAGIDSGELDLFLAEYKKAGIPPIPRKAVLTVYNQNWTVSQLFEDLEEHVAKSG